MDYMSTKEIAKEIRESLKKEFPNLKFSVSKEEYSGGASINVCLMSGNFNPFNNTYLDQFKASFRGFEQVNQYHIDSDKYLNDKSKEIFKKVLEIIKKRHYDHSDSMTDYFDTNFYIHLGIGKWNKSYIDTTMNFGDKVMIAKDLTK